MPTSRFDDFVSEAQGRRTEVEPIDWSQRLKEWQEDIQSLYATVRHLLRSYVENGRIELKNDPALLNDERFEVYSTEVLILTIGPEIIKFIPRSPFVIGAFGRFDVRGPKGSAKLVLVDRDATKVSIAAHIVDPSTPSAPYAPPPRERLVWKIASSRSAGTFKDLTQETLQELILEVANG